MFKKKSLAFLLAFLFLISGSATAEMTAADQKAAADAPKKFFQAVNAQDFATAWSLLTEKSKSYFTTISAKEAKLPVAEVRRLFETADPAIVGGFWTSFRDKSKADVFAKALYVFQGENGDSCMIAVTPYIKEYSKTIVILSKNEGGYKFALVETMAATPAPAP